MLEVEAILTHRNEKVKTIEFDTFADELLADSFYASLNAEELLDNELLGSFEAYCGDEYGVAVREIEATLVSIDGIPCWENETIREKRSGYGAF